MSVWNVGNQKDGYLASQEYVSTPREIFFSGRNSIEYIAAPVTVDGSNTSCPTNSPYIFVILAGSLLGRITATKKYASSILGLTSAVTNSGATTVSTDVNTAAEIVRRLGSSGTFNLTGPAAASGAVATQLVTYSSVATATGVVTCTATSAASVNGSLIQPNDGSQNIMTLVTDINGIKVTDASNTQRVDAYDPELLASGTATINTGFIISYPTDPSLQLFVQAAINSFAGSGIRFQTQQTG